VAIAEHVAGTVDAFCRMMTERAEEMGCENTVFTTPHGLPAQNHHTTAWDLALICRHALKNQEFRRIVSTKRAVLPWAGHENRVLNNKNSLLSSYDGALGIKTGYTRAAGRCLAFAAERNGMTVVGCVLNAPDWFRDAAAIMDAGFEKYEMVSLLSENETVGLVPVEGGIRESVRVYADKALSVPVEKGTLPEMKTSLPTVLTAPVKKGDPVGEAYAVDGGQVWMTVPLYAADDVEEESFRFWLGRIFTHWAAR
jgi:D-alanyl-D-alanine carboxypeptidase (penicillin-binding protein 5/6)